MDCLNAFSAGQLAEGKISEVAAKNLAYYNIAIATAWKSTGIRLLNNFAFLVSKRPTQLNDFLNVVRGIFLYEWMLCGSSKLNKISAYKFPFGENQELMRMQFGLTESFKKEKITHHFALPAHYDPVTLVIEFLKSWKNLEKTLTTPEEKNAFTQLARDLGISKFDLNNLNKIALIKDFINFFSTPSFQSFLTSFKPETSSLKLYESILFNEAESLPISIQLTLLQKVASISAQINLKNLIGINNSGTTSIVNGNTIPHEEGLKVIQELYEIYSQFQNLPTKQDILKPLSEFFEFLSLRTKREELFNSQAHLRRIFGTVIFEILKTVIEAGTLQGLYEVQSKIIKYQHLNLLSPALIDKLHSHFLIRAQKEFASNANADLLLIRKIISILPNSDDSIKFNEALNIRIVEKLDQWLSKKIEFAQGFTYFENFLSDTNPSASLVQKIQESLSQYFIESLRANSSPSELTLKIVNALVIKWRPHLTMQLQQYILFVIDKLLLSNRKCAFEICQNLSKVSSESNILQTKIAEKLTGILKTELLKEIDEKENAEQFSFHKDILQQILVLAELPIKSYREKFKESVSKYSEYELFSHDLILAFNVSDPFELLDFNIKNKKSSRISEEVCLSNTLEILQHSLIKNDFDKSLTTWKELTSLQPSNNCFINQEIIVLAVALLKQEHNKFIEEEIISRGHVN